MESRNLLAPAARVQVHFLPVHFGYHGQILHVDLSSGCTHIEKPQEEFWRIYAGGGLLATALLLRDTPSGLDPFDPANLLIFSSSVIAGHPYPGLARFTVAAKSPLTNGIGETRCEGPFGQALKGCGFDAIVIRGAAQSPVTLLVDAETGTIEIASADQLWRLNTSLVFDALETSFGANIQAAVIGPAGENQVRFASIVASRHHQASRMGMGAVMGSKNLKALVIRGENRPPVADLDTCNSLAANYAVAMRENPLTRWQLDPPGFSAWVHTHGIDAALCVNNYRESVFDHAANYRPELFLAHHRGVAPCPGCPNNCIHLLNSGPQSSGIHQEITGALGPNCGISNLETVLRANGLCMELGLDPTSLGFTLSMAMECAERGILQTNLCFGNDAALIEAISNIAHRKGLGDILAEGSARAAASLGPEASRYALHVKGLEMVPFEPRTQTNLALGYAISPIGPRYDICEHDWDFDTESGWPHSMDNSRTLGILKRIPMQHLGIDKVRNCKALMTIWSAADALEFCIFAVAPTRVYSLDQMAQLLSAITGWQTSSHELMRIGERRLHLMRLYNHREGLPASSDTLPDRFFDDPIPQGKWTGTRLDRTTFAACVQTFYRMMGWDDTGVPRYETLLDHQLEQWAPLTPKGPLS